MNELVTEDVIGVGVDAGQGHYHPVAERFREAPDPFFDRSPGRRRLLEVSVVRVEDQRLPD